MALWYNDATDDPLLHDEQRVIRGAASYFRSSDLGPDVASQLKNVEIESNGVVRTRRGVHLITDEFLQSWSKVHAMYHCQNDLWDNGVLIFADGNVYLKNLTEVVWVAQNVYQSGKEPWDCSVAEIAGNVYFSDGDSYMLQLCPLANSYTELAFLVSDTGAKIVDDNGDPLLATTGDSIVWSVSGGGAVPGTGESDSSFYQDLRCLTSHTFRLFAAKDVDTVVVSKILPGCAGGVSVFDDAATNGSALFSHNASFRVGQGDSDKIVALVPYKDFRLAVLKDHSIYIVNADPAQSDISNWAIQQVSDKVGCVAEKSAVNVGDDIFFLSRDGVRSVATAFQQEQLATSEPLSYPIHDIIERINWEFADRSVGAFWKGKYILGVPLDSATVPDYCIVFNTNTRQWAGFWTGFSPLAFTVSELPGERKKLLVAIRETSTDSIQQLRDYLDEDSATDDDYMDKTDGTNTSLIDYQLITRAFTFGERLNPKNVDYVELEFLGSKAYVDVRLIGDDSDETLFSNGEGVFTGAGYLTLPFDLPADLVGAGVIRKQLSTTGKLCAREIKVKVSPTPVVPEGVSDSEQAYVAVKSVAVGGFLESLEAQT